LAVRNRRLTSAEIDDARRMIVLQFGRMQRENRVGLYRSTARAIKVAADELVIRRMLSGELADAAVPVAIDWVQRTAAHDPHGSPWYWGCRGGTTDAGGSPSRRS
jgi:hypothetical protein